MQRRPGPVLVALAASVAPWPSVAHAQAFDAATLRQRTVLTPGGMFGMLPPELIAAPVVKRIAFSSDDRYALVEREVIRFRSSNLEEAAGEEPRQEMSLILWDSRSRVSKEVWKAPLPAGAAQQIAWLPGSDIALVVLGQPHGPEAQRALLRITGATGKAEPIGLTELGDVGVLQLSVSPTRPQALLRHTPYQLPDAAAPEANVGKPAEPQPTLHVLGEGSGLGARVPLPEGARIEAIQWDTVAYPVVRLREKNGGAPRWYLLDTHAVQLRPLDKEPALYPAEIRAADEPAAGLPIRIKTSTLAADESKPPQSVSLLWLEGTAGTEKPRALICGDGTGGRILPRANVIVYQSQGAAWAVPLLRAGREAYAALAGAGVSTQQVAAIKQSKQIGLALLMYLREHDDTLPNGDDIREKLAPYLPSPDLLDGFSYTHKGGKLADVGDPAETEIGSLDGPGGRVRIYADGHVTLDQ